MMNTIFKNTAAAVLTLLALNSNAGQLSLGVSLENSQYAIADKEAESNVAPIFIYQGERFSMIAGTFSYTLIQSDSLQFNLLGQGRSEGYDAGDSDMLTGMDEREESFDAGIGLTSGGLWGVVQLEVMNDVSGTYEGNELSASYSFPRQYGRWTLEPSIGVKWQSRELVDYYYGVKTSEVMAGRARYRGDRAINPHAEFNLAYKLDRQWMVMGGMSYIALDDSIVNSPIIDEDYRLSAYSAMLYQF